MPSDLSVYSSAYGLYQPFRDPEKRRVDCAPYPFVGVVRTGSKVQAAMDETFRCACEARGVLRAGKAERMILGSVEAETITASISRIVIELLMTASAGGGVLIILDAVPRNDRMVFRI